MKNEIKGVYNYTSLSIPGQVIIKACDDDELMDGKSQILFRSKIGSLLYLSRFTHPDLSNLVRELTKVTSKGTLSHYKQLSGLLNTLRILRATV